MSLLSQLKTKKPSAAVTLNFQISPEIAAKLEDAAKRAETPRYDVCRLLIESGLNTLLEELDDEVPDLTPTPEYTDTIADDLD